MRLPRIYVSPLGMSRLHILLGCSIIKYVLLKSVPAVVYQVKIHDRDLQDAIHKAREIGFIIDLWRSRSSSHSLRSVFRAESTAPADVKQHVTPMSFKLTCWNCRGLKNSTQCLNELISDGSDVVVLSEHWLWPFELYQLQDVHPDYTGWGQADSRLSNTSDNTRDCGGVGFIWRRNLCCTTITGTVSDCICGICLKIKDSQQSLSVIAVFFPCTHLGMDYCRDCMAELEDLVEKSK